MSTSNEESSPLKSDRNRELNELARQELFSTDVEMELPDSERESETEFKESKPQHLGRQDSVETVIRGQDNVDPVSLPQDKEDAPKPRRSDSTETVYFRRDGAETLQRDKEDAAKPNRSNSMDSELRKRNSTDAELPKTTTDRPKTDSKDAEKKINLPDSDVEMLSARSDAKEEPEPKKQAHAKKERRRKAKERPAPPEAPPQKLNWKLNLRVLISNLYMSSEDRLPGACVPKCLNNTSKCVDKHRSSILPDAPSFTATQALRTTLHGQHYDTFLDILEMMVLQCVYPGDAIFERLIDMTMILIAKDMSVKELGDTYNKLIRTFFLLIDAFPPCWTALRPYYLNFLGVPKPGLRENRTNNPSPQKLKFYLDLLEENIAQCSDEEIRENTKFYEKYVFNYSEEEDANMSQETVFLRHVHQYDWLSGKLNLDDFKRMSASVRLARLFDVLNMLTWILEMEFLSWLDHNRLRQSESEFFQEDTKPFAAIVFEMSASTRLTDIVRQVMRLYGLAASKSMYPERLRILQRLIILAVEVSNTAELKYEDNKVIYPHLGPQTRLLIAEFFKIFKIQNPKYISTYLKIIPQIEQPYLRYEFTDHFLQLFYFPKNLPFGPEKACDEFTTRQWLRYRSMSQIEEDDEQLCREDYLKLLLNAVKDYDAWCNLAGFWKCLRNKRQVLPLQTRTSSPLATPVGVITGDTGKVFMLDEMEEEVHTWKKRMNTKVIIGRPKVNLPVARINVAKMCLRYGEDVRQLRYLRRLLQNEIQKEGVDVSEWLTYLNDFLGDDEPLSQPDTTEGNDSEAS